MMRIILIIALLCSTSAVAQVRTFVSTGGIDNASCSRSQPCRTFNAGIQTVQAGGEVVVLDSGGYGPAQITRSVALITPRGLHAAIVAASGNGIDINAAATDRVILQNITIVLPGSTFGVQATSFGSLFIHDFEVTSGFVGIRVTPTNAAKVFITDTTVRNALTGVQIGTEPSASGKVRALVSGLRIFSDGLWGLYLGPTSSVTCVDCESHGGGSGFFLITDPQAGRDSELTCERCVSSGNQTGFYANGSTPGIAILRLSRSVAALNDSYGVFHSGNSTVFVLSGTNAFTGNPVDKDGVMTPAPADNP